MTADPGALPLPALLKSTEVAELLAVDKTTVCRWAQAGLISRYGEHKRTRYDRDEVLAFAARRNAAAEIGTVRERLLSRLIIRPSGCLEWSGSQDNRGYGTLRVDAYPAKVYRLMYEMFVGPIPERYDVDHLCRNTICAAPAHLEAVTHQVNIQRGFDVKPKKPKCLRGHDRTPENVMPANGGCRECRRENDRERRATACPIPIRPPLNEDQQPGTIPGAAA